MDDLGARVGSDQMPSFSSSLYGPSVPAELSMHWFTRVLLFPVFNAVFKLTLDCLGRSLFSVFLFYYIVFFLNEAFGFPSVLCLH
jgi:hypothetical protein